MIYSSEVENMCVVKKGANHGPAPIPEEGRWVKAKEIKDISGLTQPSASKPPSANSRHWISSTPIIVRKPA